MTPLLRLRARAVGTLLAAVLGSYTIPGLAEDEVEDAVQTPETTLDGVVIEAEPLQLERTIEELMQRFREALGRDRFDMPFSERPLPGGARELHTRFGRFWVVPVPTQFGSDLARGIDLAMRCAAF